MAEAKPKVLHYCKTPWPRCGSSQRKSKYRQGGELHLYSGHCIQDVDPARSQSILSTTGDTVDCRQNSFYRCKCRRKKVKPIESDEESPSSPSLTIRPSK